MPAITLLIAFLTAAAYITVVPGAETRSEPADSVYTEAGDVQVSEVDETSSAKGTLSRIAETVAEHVYDSWNRARHFLGKLRPAPHESASGDCPESDCGRRLPGNIITPYVIEMPPEGA